MRRLTIYQHASAMTMLGATDGGEHALDLGDPVKDADYYRLTQTEARRQYDEIRKAAKKLK